VSKIQEAVDVDVPLSVAYNQWTQFESFPQFMSGVERVTQVDDTHNHWVTTVMGATREFDTEIIDQQPDRRIAWRSTGGDTKHIGLVTFEPLAEDQTRVNILMEWEPEGLTEKVGSAVMIDEVQVRKDAHRFKEFIEHRQAETGGWRGEVAPGGSS
jgi:uncharacterized membrane protein